MDLERKTYHELPLGVFERTRRGKVFYFCYVGKGAERKEVSLGSSRRALSARYDVISELAAATTRHIPNDYANALYLRARKSAQHRHIVFSITEEEIEEKLRGSGNKCAVTGITFSLRKEPGIRIRPWMPSLDRIDASKGYTNENCRIVCASVNLALNQFGEGMFYKIAYATVMTAKFCGTEA
jgi:hypothetical protein